MSTIVANTDGFILHGWMVNELKLEGGDLIAFALVHQFVQSGAGIYKGNTAYLSAWTGWTEKTSRGHLTALQKRGLIAEVRGRENNTPFCYYKLGPAFPEALKSTRKKLPGDPEKITAEHPVKISKSTRKKLPGENTTYIENTRNENTITPPTPSEVAEYVKEMVQDPEGFALYYTTQMTNNNWTYGKKATPVKNWKNNVLQWVKYHKNEDFSYMLPQATPTPNPAPFTVSSKQLQTLIP